MSKWADQKKAEKTEQKKEEPAQLEEFEQAMAESVNQLQTAFRERSSRKTNA